MCLLDGCMKTNLENGGKSEVHFQTTIWGDIAGPITSIFFVLIMFDVDNHVQIVRFCEYLFLADKPSMIVRMNCHNRYLVNNNCHSSSIC